MAAMHTQEVATCLATARDWPDTWRRGSDLSDFTLRLTPEQAAELNEKVHELISTYRDMAPGADARDTAQVRMHLHAFPRSTD